MTRWQVVRKKEGKIGKLNLFPTSSFVSAVIFCFVGLLTFLLRLKEDTEMTVPPRSSFRRPLDLRCRCRFRFRFRFRFRCRCRCRCMCRCTF